MKSEIIALVLDNRNSDAPNVQEVLTRYGCIIKTRLGIHEIEGCSNQGLILLVTHGEEKDIKNLRDDLKEFKMIEVKSMEI